MDKTVKNQVTRLEFNGLARYGTFNGTDLVTLQVRINLLLETFCVYKYKISAWF